MSLSRCLTCHSSRAQSRGGGEIKILNNQLAPIAVTFIPVYGRSLLLLTVGARRISRCNLDEGAQLRLHRFSSWWLIQLHYFKQRPSQGALFSLVSHNLSDVRRCFPDKTYTPLLLCCVSTLKPLFLFLIFSDFPLGSPRICPQTRSIWARWRGRVSCPTLNSMKRFCRTCSTCPPGWLWLGSTATKLPSGYVIGPSNLIVELVCWVSLSLYWNSDRVQKWFQFVHSTNSIKLIEAKELA